MSRSLRGSWGCLRLRSAVLVLGIRWGYLQFSIRGIKGRFSFWKHTVFKHGKRNSLSLLSVRVYTDDPVDVPMFLVCAYVLGQRLSSNS